ncbi:restriction endonuclease subunit S [Enterococcus cecorum]|uniref:restriction endonuclease subunit S n=1 Tax=Enterococcus cecorum TaxID=44008 RepID=UPI002ACA084A|nr:restriction endonuclease subunit S [Enterococcus cecorum]MDZ5503306.1 restriction endonuclease subunit S [Enterococcus cecorum]MDZ5592153.1 restriction endonuclease subunit S [Enterococcus cecorum]
MAEWKIFKVGDIGQIITGKTPKTSNTSYYGGQIPFLTPSDDMSVKYVRKTKKNITESGRLSVKNATLPANAVCVSCIGSDLGKVVITTEPTVTNQQINSIIVDEDKFDIDYIYYAMLELGKILKFHSKTSTAVPIVNKRSFSQYELKCPPLTIQKKVGKLLSIIDNKIEENERINNNLEQQAFTIFDHMFPNITTGNKIVGDFISPQRGKNLLSKNAIPGDVPVIAGGLTPATFHNEANTIAPVLTISASGANAGYVNLWNVPVWSSDSSFIDSRMTDNVYFWYVMLKKRQQEIFDAQTGSAQPHIYPRHINELPIANLDSVDINKFTEFITPLFQKIGASNLEMDKLGQLRDSLLPKLMSGEIDVSNIEL